MATVFALLFRKSGIEMLFRQFGETVEYVPGVGNTKHITAIVDRDVAFIGDGSGDVNAQATQIRFRDDAILGMLGREVNTAKDYVRYSKREGEKPSAHRVVRVESVENGIVSVFVQ